MKFRNRLGRWKVEPFRYCEIDSRQERCYFRSSAQTVFLGIISGLDNGGGCRKLAVGGGTMLGLNSIESQHTFNISV